MSLRNIGGALDQVCSNAAIKKTTNKYVLQIKNENKKVFTLVDMSKAKC